MNDLKTLFASIFVVLLGTALFAQTGSKPSPKISVMPSIVLHPHPVFMKGSGFTPKADVNSHLRRPDGTEFRILQMYTNDKGEVEHDIDTIVMTPGVYELWIDDPTAKTTSNIAKFEVTFNSKDLEK